MLLQAAPDEPKRLRELIIEGLQSDLLLLAGGVSMGNNDLVEQVLAGAAGQNSFSPAPGFSRESRLCSDAFPGKITTHTLWCFPGIRADHGGIRAVRAAAPEALAGQTPRKLTFLHAKLKSGIKTKTGLRRFLPATLSGEFEGAEVELAPWHGSGDIAAMALANCYVVIPPDREYLAEGDWVAVLMR